jgi:hypothetical protein
MPGSERNFLERINSLYRRGVVIPASVNARFALFNDSGFLFEVQVPNIHGEQTR